MAPSGCLGPSILEGWEGPEQLAGIRALSSVTRLSSYLVDRCSLCRRFAPKHGWPGVYLADYACEQEKKDQSGVVKPVKINKLV